jgi:DNA repair exonuclease SbcCD ATPase subunit
MPPPPSPKLSQLQPNDTSVTDDVSPAIEIRHKTHMRSYSRPSSSTSFRSAATDEVTLAEQLQSRLDALEYENERLRTASEAEPVVDSVQLQSEKQIAIDRVAELEAKLAGLEQSSQTRDDELQKLEIRNSELTTQLNEATLEVKRSLVNHEQESQAHHATLKSLRDQVQELERLISQKDEVIDGHKSDVATLRSDLARAYADLEEDRKELGAQIDELRIAGQVSYCASQNRGQF